MYNNGYLYHCHYRHHHHQSCTIYYKPRSYLYFSLSFYIVTAAVKTVVFYRRDNDTRLAVGYHHPERRVLHGKKLPAGFEVVQLTWVRGPGIPAPIIMGDPDENSTLSAGQFFALPRKDLVKVVPS